MPTAIIKIEVPSDNINICCDWQCNEEVCRRISTDTDELISVDSVESSSWIEVCEWKTRCW